MNFLRYVGRLALVAGVGAAVAASSEKASAQARESAQGSWRLVSAKANGQAIDFPAGTTILKHVTATHFMFVHYDTQGRITVAGGGRYTLSGTRYQETVEYGLGEGLAPLIGKAQVFTLRIERGRWYQSGTESTGTAIEEVWEPARD